ncbi:MAG: sodium transport system ATP-binding protein [Lentisphaeria bacterium]|jgi:sodium transport system ATP-binding protein
MIEIKNIHKTFGEVVAVDDVSFSAHRGEIYGLLGPNGAGKTTTLRMLYGLFSPSRGHLHVDGLNVSDNTLAVQKRMGVLPDGGSLYTRLTARENIRYFGELQGVDKNTIEQSIERFVDILDMSAIIDRRTAGFSQGERMKVSLARAIVHNPDYVLLDEPTNGLDVLTTRAVRELLLRLKAEGKCVIFSSHLMHEVANVCDRVGIIAHGKMLIDGPLTEVIAKANTPTLEDAFVHFAYANEEHRPSDFVHNKVTQNAFDKANKKEANNDI